MRTKPYTPPVPVKTGLGIGDEVVIHFPTEQGQVRESAAMAVVHAAYAMRRSVPFHVESDLEGDIAQFDGKTLEANSGDFEFAVAQVSGLIAAIAQSFQSPRPLAVPASDSSGE